MRQRASGVVRRARSLAHVTTFADAAVGRHNNLNLLRMIAASSVVFSHSYWLTGTAPREPMIHAFGWFDLATFGVVLFFAISGFLIAQSLCRNASLLAYASRRALRIVPGLALAAIVSVGIGALATTLPSSVYWHCGETWHFLLGTPLLMLRETLPGVFLDNPFARAVNGSLWTIPVEVTCYALAAIAASARAIRRPLAFVAFACVVEALCLRFPEALQALMPYRVPPSVALLVGTFLTGAAIYVARRYVPVSLGLAAAVIVAIWAGRTGAFGAYLFFWAAAYVVLVLAYHPRVQLTAYRRVGDYSYGTYVLAFPIQQYLVARFGLREPLLLFATSMALILPLAALSWHLLEKPALALKRRIPGPRPSEAIDDAPVASAPHAVAKLR